MFGLRKRLWLRPFIAFGFFILLLGSLQWATEVSAQKSSPARQDIILLLDNSRSMGAPSKSFDEPNRRRIRIARLLARYLMLVEPETTSLGVAVFGPQTTPRVPLKPLSQWQERDISAIQPLSCPERKSEGDSESRPGEDPCNGTRYSRALSWAQDQLQDCLEIHQQHPEKQDCRIIVVTDSKLTRNLSGDSDSPEEIHQAFQSASVSGAESFILFLDDYPQTEWQRWRDEGLFEYEHKLASMPLDIWLDRILHFLQLPAAQKQMTKLRLEDKPQQVQIGPLPRFLSWLQVDAAPENAPTVTFPDAPIPYQRGYRYRWFRPAFSSLSMQLDGQGFVYYRVISEPAPLQVYPVQIPSEPTEDDPIQLRVWASVFEDVLTAKDRVRVIAHGDVMTQALALTSMPDGSWRGTVPPLPAGSHTLTLSVEVEENGSWQIRARKPISIYIRPLEMLPVLEVSPTVAFTGTPITFKTWLLDEQKYRLVGKSVPVTVHVASPYLKNQGISIPLSPDGDVPGVWRATTAIEPWLDEDLSLAYPLTLTATLFISGARVATSDAIPLRIWDYPSLDLSHERLQDGSVLVTVTVKGLANPITPTLYSDAGLVKRVPWRHEKRIFIWKLEPPKNHLIIWASLRIQEPVLGVISAKSKSIDIVNEDNGTLIGYILKWGWLLVIVVVIIFMVILMLKRDKKGNEREEIKSYLNEIQKETDLESKRKMIIQFINKYGEGSVFARKELANRINEELKRCLKKVETSQGYQITDSFWNNCISNEGETMYKELVIMTKRGNYFTFQTILLGIYKFYKYCRKEGLVSDKTTINFLFEKDLYELLYKNHRAIRTEMLIDNSNITDKFIEIIGDLKEIFEVIDKIDLNNLFENTNVSDLANILEKTDIHSFTVFGKVLDFIISGVDASPNEREKYLDKIMSDIRKDIPSGHVLSDSMSRIEKITEYIKKEPKNKKSEKQIACAMMNIAIKSPYSLDRRILEIIVSLYTEIYTHTHISPEHYVDEC